jgi:hypothetical protein
LCWQVLKLLWKFELEYADCCLAVLALLEGDGADGRRR